jgi:hypothetical protein
MLAESTRDYYFDRSAQGWASEPEVALHQVETLRAAVDTRCSSR